jgi:hypothetical protein
MLVFSSGSFCSIGASKLGENVEKERKERKGRMKEKNRIVLNKRERQKEKKKLLSDAVANCRVLMGWAASTTKHNTQTEKKEEEKNGMIAVPFIIDNRNLR